VGRQQTDRDGEEAGEAEGGCDADAEVAPLEAGLLDDGDDGDVSLGGGVDGVG
jgi:hypothetical protein